MAIIFDHEPDVRTAWHRFERNRRIANHNEVAHHALLTVVLATSAFWLIVGFGLYIAL